MGSKRTGHDNNKATCHSHRQMLEGYIQNGTVFEDIRSLSPAESSLFSSTFISGDEHPSSSSEKAVLTGTALLAIENVLPKFTTTPPVEQNPQIGSPSTAFSPVASTTGKVGHRQRKRIKTKQHTKQQTIARTIIQATTSCKKANLGSKDHQARQEKGSTSKGSLFDTKIGLGAKSKHPTSDVYREGELSEVAPPTFIPAADRVLQRRSKLNKLSGTRRKHCKDERLTPRSNEGIDMHLTSEMSNEAPTENSGSSSLPPVNSGSESYILANNATPSKTGRKLLKLAHRQFSKRFTQKSAPNEEFARVDRKKQQDQLQYDAEETTKEEVEARNTRLEIMNLQLEEQKQQLLWQFQLMKLHFEEENLKLKSRLETIMAQTRSCPFHCQSSAAFTSDNILSPAPARAPTRSSRPYRVKEKRTVRVTEYDPNYCQNLSALFQQSAQIRSP